VTASGATVAVDEASPRGESALLLLLRALCSESRGESCSVPLALFDDLDLLLLRDFSLVVVVVVVVEPDVTLDTELVAVGVTVAAAAAAVRGVTVGVDVEVAEVVVDDPTSVAVDAGWVLFAVMTVVAVVVVAVSLASPCNSITKFCGKTPTLPLSSPFHHPLADFEKTRVQSEAIVDS
jgi:hypothetical protein